MTIFSKELLWLQDYLLLAHTIINKTEKLKKVSVIKPREKTLCRIQGQLTQREDNFYTMILYLKYTSVSKLWSSPKINIRDYSTIDLLCTFAHELAHLEHWKHTPKHKMLEAKLVILFMARLSTKGYISEEKEGINSDFPCRQQ